MAPDWLGITSSNIDSDCGCGETGETLADCIDGLADWDCNTPHCHWFILDLGQSYTITKVRGRSHGGRDPTNLDIWVSDDKENWGDPVAEDITTWQDTTEWQEVETTEKEGRYVKVQINSCETSLNYFEWNGTTPQTMIDVYGEVGGAGPETHTPSDTAKASDSIATKVSNPLSDLAKANDNVAVKTGIPISDTAKATDSIETKVGAPLSDLAKASDSVSFKASISISDNAHASDVIFPNKLTLTDIASANDSVTFSMISVLSAPTENIMIIRGLMV